MVNGLVTTACDRHCVCVAGVFVHTGAGFDVGVLHSLLLDINQQLRMWTVSSPHPSVSESNDLLDSSTL